MALIEWKDEFSVHIAEFDHQHQRLIAMINSLHDAIAENRTQVALVKTLARMAEYAVSHFTAEEECLARSGYPEAAIHALEHQNFVNTLRAFEQDFIEGNITLSDEVIIFLKDWLTNHILVSDKKYSTHLHEHGVK